MIFTSVTELSNNQEKRFFKEQVDVFTRLIEVFCEKNGVKNKEFTDLGLILRGLTGVEQSVRLAQIIVSDIVFGEVYFMQKFLGIDMTVEDVAERMKKYVVFDSEAMYLRRSSTVCSWIKWILRQEEQSGNEY